MAIERGVDDVDIQELEIEDNSKEVEVNVEDESFDELLGSGFEDDEVETLEDGTMLFGAPPPMMPQAMGAPEDFYEKLGVPLRLKSLDWVLRKRTSRQRVYKST